MARAGTSKARSLDQEDHVAAVYGGRRSRSSGASIRDPADVMTDLLDIECKTTGGPGEKPVELPGFVKELEKLARKAFANGKAPILALRYYKPESILADYSGWVDLAVKPLDVDADHEAQGREEDR